MNGQHVVLQPDTGYGPEKDKQTSSGSPLRDAVEVGADVVLLGSFDNRTNTATARTVLLRDDWDRRLIGLGVIDRVVFAGPEPVFQADGYQIRITPSTETAFHGEVKTLADVGTNTWLRYEGRRDKDGALLASKAGFLPGKTIKIKAVAGVESVDMQLEEPDFAGHKDGRVKIAWMSGWRKIPADRDLQERIKRAALSVIPAYQRAMADDDAFKIRFRFYAIDDDRLRSEVCSVQGELILVPRQVMERVKNDSQLAAVLADGVAYALQRQGVRRITEEHVRLGEEAAGAALVAFAPGVAMVLAADGATPRQGENVLLEEQRGRSGLALLADGGYDPWEAPEAWRLLAPKHLPNDLGSLKYPDRSGYQLGILNLQYKRNRAVAATR